MTPTHPRLAARRLAERLLATARQTAPSPEEEVGALVAGIGAALDELHSIPRGPGLAMGEPAARLLRTARAAALGGAALQDVGETVRAAALMLGAGSFATPAPTEGRSTH